jgi:hypothetical protein
MRPHDRHYRANNPKTGSGIEFLIVSAILFAVICWLLAGVIDGIPLPR